MKRVLSSIIVLVIIFSLLVGCGKTGDQGNGKTDGDNSGLSGSYTMATAGTAGTFYPFGGALSQIVNEEVGTKITPTATGGGKENLALLENEEVDFALLDADLMAYALTGTEVYEGKQINTFGTISSLFPQVIQIIVAEDSDIHSVADLKGKRVSIGDPGSGTSINARQIFEAFGISLDDMKISNISFKESASAFQDNSLDAFIGVAGIPTSAVTETSLLRKIRVVPIEKEHAANLIEKYPFFSSITIGKDVYNMSEDIETLAVNATIVALKSVSEEVVYAFTKTMFEKQAELAMVHVKGEEVTLENALNGLEKEFLHPGAAKYYKEVGILE